MADCLMVAVITKIRVKNISYLASIDLYIYKPNNIRS